MSYTSYAVIEIETFIRRNGSAGEKTKKSAKPGTSDHPTRAAVVAKGYGHARLLMPRGHTRAIFYIEPSPGRRRRRGPALPSINLPNATPLWDDQSRSPPNV